MTEDVEPDRLPTGARRCKAHNRQGERCHQPAMQGTTVCRFHGGKSPTVAAKNRRQLLELVDSAIARLSVEMDNPKARPIERIRAAAEVLDRTGYGKQLQVTDDVSREILKARLVQIRDQVRQSSQRAILRQGEPEVLDAEVVEPDEDRPAEAEEPGDG